MIQAKELGARICSGEGSPAGLATVNCAIFTMSLGFRDPDPFARFVPNWYRSIAAMNPLPSEVVIALPPGDSSGADRTPDSFPVPVRIVRVPESRNPTEFLNAAVSATTAKWVSWCGIDDVVTPDALADIPMADEAGADVMASWYLADGRKVGGWEPRAMAAGGINNTAANSPFTREVFARVGGWADIHFHDWGLWLRLTKANARVFITDRVGMVQDLGHGHVTRSGVQMPIDLRIMAVNEINSLVRQLWPEGYCNHAEAK